MIDYSVLPSSVLLRHFFQKKLAVWASGMTKSKIVLYTRQIVIKKAC